MLTVLPGLVASGGALLFGVNTWCLDGRGALWRDSLPVSPRLSFYSRAVVLMEVLLCSATATLLLASLRAGRPTVAEVVALLCATLVVTLQVVSAGMRWSIARPFAVDLRSARATPAPPVVMAGYSARLAVATTFTGLIFSGLAQLGDVRFALGDHRGVALLVGVASPVVHPTLGGCGGPIPSGGDRRRMRRQVVTSGKLGCSCRIDQSSRISHLNPVQRVPNAGPVRGFHSITEIHHNGGKTA